MNTYVKTLVFSIIISIAWLYFLARLPIYPACDGLGCASIGIIVLFVHFIVIPIVFAILISIFLKENRFIYSFLISFMVAIVTFLPLYFYTKYENNLKQEQDFQDMKARYEANPEQYKKRPY